MYNNANLCPPGVNKTEGTTEHSLSNNYNGLITSDILQVIQNPCQVVKRRVVESGGVAASHHKVRLVSGKVLVVIKLEHV